MQLLIGDVHVELTAPGVLVGLVVARGVRAEAASDELARALDRAVAAVPPAAGEALDSTQAAVRDLLRFGTYRPTGRAKPASEYLLRAAREASFPRISNLVDVCNLVSLEARLPISLIDVGAAARAEGGGAGFRVRRGRVGEAYVFNPAGQTIALDDLLLVARLPGDLPTANPVKDSLATKLSAGSTDLLGVIYAPPALRSSLAGATEALRAGLERWGGSPRMVVSALLGPCFD